ncbi:MAG: putative MPP superfamily phosphohydrolase [Gammaproteobacteria bacterium]|jgi:predicted MPP superfamily phosphohydrolase
MAARFIFRALVDSSYRLGTTSDSQLDIFVESERHLFLSSGTGTSILPVRFLVPPEITLLIVDSGAL